MRTDRGDGSVVVAAVSGAAPVDVWHDLNAALRELSGSVRVVVFAGELFSALRGLRPPVEGGETAVARWQGPVRRLDRADVVSVASLTGPVHGPALEFALACDLRVLAFDARLAVTDVAGGSVPGLGGLALLPALVGPARALELALSARTVSAADAVTLGLAALAVPLAELTEATDDLVAALLAAPRGATTEAKALLRAAASEPSSDPLDAARAAVLRLASGEPE